jgi:ribosomal protein L34E
MPWLRPRYYKPPRDRCELCGRSLYGTERYRVRLYLKTAPLTRAPFKELVVCGKCLEVILGDQALREHFKIRYRKMRTLGR